MQDKKKIALVTGGTGGLGSAICRRLADDGYQVIAGYYGGGDHERARAWVAQERANGRDIDIQFGDVRDWAGSQAMLAEVHARHGAVSVLVNCAGITRDARLQRMTPDFWRDVIDTNLTSVFNITKGVIDDMVAAGGGSIVNISSINGLKGQFGQTNYSAAKAGMHGFTKALAQEVAAKGITVNTISPGYVETEMVRAVPEAVRNQIISQIPVGRLGQPEEIARVVAFLVADESGFITGANLSVNGGHYMH
ncbi:MAG: acetoacetyl-CoA reductase [Perlucidibaca sp.]